MKAGVKEFFMGIFVLLLALIMWRATHSFWAWLVFFIPGAFYVLFGLCQVIKERY